MLQENINEHLNSNVLKTLTIFFFPDGVILYAEFYKTSGFSPATYEQFTNTYSQEAKD